jgi:hypothetical protein
MLRFRDGPRGGGVEEEQLARDCWGGLIRTHERDDAAVGQLLDRGGELILGRGLKRDAAVNDLTPRAVGEQDLLA